MIFKLLKSFVYAFKGIGYALKTQGNMKIHLGISLLAIFLSFYWQIKTLEWLIILVMIGLVCSMEMLNTALEALADALMPETNRLVGIAKDVAAGAVLWTALISVVVGIIIFLPYI